MNLDRFSNNSIKDIQEASVYAYCAGCTYEIYNQQPYLTSPQGDIMHDRLSCIIEFYQLHRKWAGEDII